MLGSQRVLCLVLLLCMEAAGTLSFSQQHRLGRAWLCRRAGWLTFAWMASALSRDVPDQDMALNRGTRWIVPHALPRVGMGRFKKPSESMQEGRQSAEGHSTGRTGVRKQACPASPRLISTLSCNVGNLGPQLYPPGREQRMNQ